MVMVTITVGTFCHKHCVKCIKLHQTKITAPTGNNSHINMHIKSTALVQVITVISQLSPGSTAACY